MCATLVGRTAERSILQAILDSQQAEFLAIYGRRRIGKTFLIRTFFETAQDILFFTVTGAKEGSLSEQIKHFTQQIGRVFLGGVIPAIRTTWDDTFETLTQVMRTVPLDKKIVLFFDELPWMATKNGRLLQSLDYYWNQHWSVDTRIKLVVCGSSASWIMNKIINSKSGLHNRITRQIQLKPFKLKETRDFLHAQGMMFTPHQIVQIYMITGGVPYYLAGIQKGHSAAQAIEFLAFRSDSLLLKEFDNLFASLFEDPASYIELLRIISKKRHGVSQQEILEQAKLSSKGGRMTEKLRELKEAGFIVSFKPYQNKNKKYHRVIDEYTLFYLHWIEPLRDALQEDSLEPGYWQAMCMSPAWHSWAGYAFEAMCYQHLSEIRKKLNIPVTAIATSWHHVPRKNALEDGAQIDLLFDRMDHTITLCEIKYAATPFVIDKAYAKNLAHKKELFSEKTGNTKQLLMALIASSGVKHNAYSEQVVDAVVTLEDLIGSAS